MFGGGQANPYDDIVVKATDENLTSENWEIILNLCDKVQDEGEEGARNVTASLLKRLAHRNPNVQLYTLSLSEALSKNCGKVLNREIASKAFTQGLERLVLDRTTHDKVRKRTLALIAEWTEEFEEDETLGIMEECYNGLKAKNYIHRPTASPPPPAVDDEIRRKEEEELQRVLELSMQDKGGRPGWAQAYSPAAQGGGSSSSGAAGSASGGAGASTGSQAGGAGAGGSSATGPGASEGRDRDAYGFQATKYAGGYSPAAPRERSASPTRSPKAGTTFAGSAAGGYGNPATSSSAIPFATAGGQPHTTATASASAARAASPTPSTSHSTTSTTGAGGTGIVTRVLALHTFNPTEPGELAFEKGDIIKVVDRGYKDWWRGQVRGRTGIFPVNYVEPLPDPTPAEIAKEAEAEAAVFAQAVNVERLLTMLRAMDPERDSLAEDEEVQELYRSCMALRPKIVKLIDKYSQKRADLVSMNETFVRARTIFDRMMEESLARHTGVYEPQPPYRPQPAHQPSYAHLQQRPDSRGTWGPQQGYGPVGAPQGFPTPLPAAYPGGPQPGPGPQVGPQGGPVGYDAYAAQQHQQQQPGYQQQVQPQAQQQHLQQQPQQLGYQQPSVVQPQQHPQQQGQPQPQPQPQQQQPQLQPQQPQQQAPAATPTPTLSNGTANLNPQTGAGPVYGTQAGYVVNQQQPYGTGNAQGLVIYPEQNQQQQQQPLQPTQVHQPQQQHQQQSPQQQPQQPIQQVQVPQQQQQQQQPVQVQAASPQPQVQAQVLPQSQIQQSPQAQVQPLQPLQPQQQQVVQPQAQAQAQPQQQVHAQAQPQPQPQPQTQQAQPQQQQQGPPYVYDPNTTYADPNVQAWAQYYAKGGKDPQGAVYFVSVPGVKEGPGAGAGGAGAAGVGAGGGHGQGAAAAAAVGGSDGGNQQHQPQQQQQQVQPQQQPQHQQQLRQDSRPTPISQPTLDLPYPGDYASPQATSPVGGAAAAGGGGFDSFATNTFGIGAGGGAGAGFFSAEPQQQPGHDQQHPYGQPQAQQPHHGYGQGYQLQDPGSASARNATSQSSLPLPGAGATSQSSLPLPGTTGATSSESLGGGGGGGAGGAGPSWLLPKKENKLHGHASAQGLAGQFAGMNVGGGSDLT